MMQHLKRSDKGLRQPVNLKADGDSVVAPAYRIESLDHALAQTGQNASGPAQLKALTYTRAIHSDPNLEQERQVPNEAWHAVQQKQVRATSVSQMQSTARAGCACAICQGGGQHDSSARSTAAGFIQTSQLQHRSNSASTPIQRMATPNGDPNAGITAVLTAIETAAANPQHQTVNNANDVLGAPLAPVLPNPGAQQTFGLARYPDGIFAIGSQAFANAAGATQLGGRAPREHAEISFIINRGAPTTVWTTQDCCLFCFGYLDTQGIPHLPLRGNPFPQAWTHPTQGWQIVRRTPLGNRPHWLISAPNGSTTTYLPVDIPTPEVSDKKRKKSDHDDPPKKKDSSSSKKPTATPPENKRARVVVTSV
ncbi:MAG TPA: hypothetical protein DCG54_08425 [Anaerolineae bacterium]|jgi:hypothetical protein|nr:hypothetical protein [Anaerolineae bacterium]